MYPGILSRRKKVSPYIEMSWEKPSQIPITISANCSLRHRTTVKALGSLESGFSLSMGSKSRLGEDSTALELYHKPTSAFAWTRLLDARRFSAKELR